MGPREIMMEHLEFWTSDDCPPMSQEEIELVRKLAEVIGVKLSLRLTMEKEPVVQATAFACLDSVYGMVARR
jgi:hypothetical protein